MLQPGLGFKNAKKSLILVILLVPWFNFIVMTIRNASLHDVLSIRRLLGQLGYPDLTEQDVNLNIQAHQHEGYAILVAEIDQYVVAFVAIHWFDLFHWKEKLGRISTLCVDDAHRSKGVGRKLLGAAEKFLASKGCHKAELTSNVRRTRAHQFYHGLGYKEDSKRFVKDLKR